MLNGTARIIYGKTRPSIIGDGVSTVQQLILKTLGDMTSRTFKLFFKEFDGKDFPENLNTILPEGETQVLKFKHNLGQGSQPFLLSEENEVYPLLQSIAERAVEAVGIDFCSVDIVSIMDNEEEPLQVLEINSGVMFNVFLTPEYREMIVGLMQEAIEAMFE
eukprot:TRINITY_DN3590_c0_g1_i2.p1 TRINITY_DN3590_c0_g1~~TRINITY_DN3590_c0_g1_i2.p1  ORF type:complete len:162 (-),score=48.04 TRINITY_DN3590_c0_g1_i2:37-522(-)